MPEDIYFWEFTEAQRDLFITFARDHGVTTSTFREYNGMYYIEQTAANIAAFGGLLSDFDDEDGPGGVYSFGERYWSASLVPPTLWP